MNNPREYCIDCGRRYGPADETCFNCGFDPIDGDECEALQWQAELAWDAKQKAED